MTLLIIKLLKKNGKEEGQNDKFHYKESEDEELIVDNWFT